MPKPTGIVSENFANPEAKKIGTTINNRQRSMAANARRAELLRYLADGMMTKDAVAKVGVTYRTYENWRATLPAFRAQVDAVRGASRPIPVDDHTDFIVWRKEFLGTTTTWFQAQIVEALDAPDEPGSITLVLFPPEHGKTTTIEDYITWKFCIDKNYRVTYGSEAQAHSRKVLRRIRNRLETDSPFPKLIATFGPFAPIGRTDTHRGAQPWGQDFFDIYGRAAGDERDYSLVALGFGSGIAGSRTDLLVGDDLISKNNVAQSEKLLDTFRQDWLSRPGTKGRTVIIGTRVEDGDMYQMMEDEGIVDRVVRFKAHDPVRIAQFGTPWLWPERYTEVEYAKMRKNVGERAWARNYQQAPRLAGDSTFTDKMVDDAESPLRSVVSAPPPAAMGMILGLDPGFGKNAVISLAGNAERLWVLGGRVDQGLTSNQAIFAAVELQAKEHLRPGLPWLHLCIEDKAFQKGLLDDAALKELQKIYGFTVDGHQTSGLTKYDQNIGIPAMARDFNRGVIDLPGADDEPTQIFMTQFRDQLVRWRPNVKGTALTMDLVMAFWFGWLWWQRFRTGLQSRTNHQAPTTAALPWQPTVLPGGMTKVGR